MICITSYNKQQQRHRKGREYTDFRPSVNAKREDYLSPGGDVSSVYWFFNSNKTYIYGNTMASQDPTCLVTAINRPPLSCLPEASFIDYEVLPVYGRVQKWKGDYDGTVFLKDLYSDEKEEDMWRGKKKKQTKGNSFFLT